MHNLLSRQPSCLFFLQLFDPPLKHENTNLSYIVLFHSLTTHPAPSAQKVATGIILSELSVVVIAMMVICGTSAFVLLFFFFFSFPLFILQYRTPALDIYWCTSWFPWMVCGCRLPSPFVLSGRLVLSTCISCQGKKTPRSTRQCHSMYNTHNTTQL